MYVIATATNKSEPVFVSIDDLDISPGCCGPEECPARWGDWSLWSECSEGCGAGTKWRGRRCYNPNNQKRCRGYAHRERECSPEIDCQESWASWEEWTACYPACDNGTKLRWRWCQTWECTGPSKDSETCTLRDCPEYNEIEVYLHFNLLTTGKFECNFETDNCAIEHAPYCNGSFGIAIGPTRGLRAHSGRGYMLVDYNDLHTNTAACVTTPRYNYYRRVCISFYAFLTGPSPEILTIEAIPFNVTPTRHGRHGVYAMVLHTTQRWQLHKVPLFLIRPSTHFSFVAFVTHNASTSKLAIDDLNITKGCCPGIPCEASWEKWSAWSRCAAGCYRGSMRTRLCDSPTNGTYCEGLDRQFANCDEVKASLCIHSITDGSAALVFNIFLVALELLVAIR